MAVPQRRISKTRKRLRRTHFKLSAKGLVACSHCGEMIQPHKVCPFCGYYNGKPVMKMKADKNAPKTEAPKKKESKKADKSKEEKK